MKKSGQIVEMYTESPKANDQKKSKSLAHLLWNDFCAIVIRTPMLIMEMEVLRKEDKVDAQDLLRDDLNASYSTLYTAFIHLATNKGDENKSYLNNVKKRRKPLGKSQMRRT